MWVTTRADAMGYEPFAPYRGWRRKRRLRYRYRRRPRAGKLFRSFS